MRTSYRNVIFVGFTLKEQSKIKIKDIRKLKSNWSFMASHLRRFPYVLHLQTIEEALKHQGFAVIIKYRDELSLEAFYKKYYKRLSKKYYHVIVCNKWQNTSEIEMIDEEKLYSDRFILELNSWYYAFLKSEERRRELEIKIKEKPKKGNFALELKEYIKDKDSITSKEIANHFNLPLRTAQRYINYMQEIFENVEYDHKTKSWLRK